MSPDIQLVLGCLGLSLIITYAWWARVRVDLLRLQLSRILEKLDATEITTGTSGNPGHLWARRCIERIIRGAPYYTSPVTLILSQKHLQKPSGYRSILEMIDECPGGLNVAQSQSDATERYAVGKALMLLMIFYFLGSISGLLTAVRTLRLSDLNTIFQVLWVLASGKMNSEFSSLQKTAISRFVGAHLL